MKKGCEPLPAPPAMWDSRLFFLSASLRLRAPDPQDAGAGPIQASVRRSDQAAQVDGAVRSRAEARPPPAAAVG